jgi:hypothetical protein
MSNAIIEAIGRCEPDTPLQPGDPRWQDFTATQGRRPVLERMSIFLQSAETQRQYAHIAFAGHRGCGKSTELHRFTGMLAGQGYLVLAAEYDRDVNANDISFSDVFLLMLRLLEERFRTDGRLRPLPDKAVRNVQQWFYDVTKIDEKEVERTLAYEAEAGLGLDTPLAKLLWALKAIRKTTGKQREEIKQAVERFPSHLANHLNLLLDDARKIAAGAYPKGIVFVVDNIDRLPLEQVDDTLLRNANLFNTVNAHSVFVVPISLLYNPQRDLVEDRYASAILPMVQVYRRDDASADEAGPLELLVEAVFKRVPAGLFADRGLARRLARLSGGCWRDLLRLLQESLMDTRERIDAEAVDDYRLLAQAYLTQTVDNSLQAQQLLYRRDALEYDGDRWIGVHPLLWESPQFRAALDEEKRRRGLNLSPSQ